MAAETTSNQLDRESKYTGNLNQLWLYTPSKKLLNLKTLECLDGKDNLRVALRRCTVDRNATQMWHCNSSADKLYGIYDGAKWYLDFTSSRFYMGFDANYKWVANKGAVSRSICDIPDTYKGCYRFTDGTSVKRFSSKPQLKNCTGKFDGDCFQKYKISAPIFSGDGHSSNCSIVWQESYFSVNDQPWKKFRWYENNFHHGGTELQPGVIEFEFHEDAKRVWAGALMKLEVHCQDYNPFTQKAAFENQCMLLKFDGVFNESLHKHPPTHHSTKTHECLATHHPTKTPDWRKGRPESSNPDSRYKSSAIALSVVLAVVLLIVIVVTVMVYRRHSTRAWVATNGVDDDVSAKPFCDTEDRF
ncbi:Hypothetical predicted protein [Paramuricea clavata]|uniref:Uncharacterized protein n=1 Tax=Paramuricea clavata TaxID=317549 RepID=A0A7D9IUJ6_PARCT|nr:Hypothetical predicted protein [Paramuricea clavata]